MVCYDQGKANNEEFHEHKLAGPTPDFSTQKCKTVTVKPSPNGSIKLERPPGDDKLE